MGDTWRGFFGGVYVGAMLLVLIACLCEYGCDKPARKESVKVLSAAGDTTGVRVLSNFWMDR